MIDTHARKPTWEQEVEINSSGEPTIAGTQVTIKKILSLLATGMNFVAIMKKLQQHMHGPTDLAMDIAVEYVEANPQEPVLVELLQQYRQQNQQRVKRILKQLKQYCISVYGERLVKLILFGSQARGDFKPSSDIDVLVVLKEPVDEQMKELVSDFQEAVLLDESELLNCLFVGENEFFHSQKLLWRNIRLEGIAV